MNVFNPGKMKRMLTRAIVLTMLVLASSVVSCPMAFAQKTAAKAQTAAAAKPTAKAQSEAASSPADTSSTPNASSPDTQDADTADDASLADLGSDNGMPAEESQGFYKSLKTKFIEGNAGFMSFVALALVLGLAFCIERIIYLSLSEIDAKKFMADLCKKMEAGDIEGGKTQCRNTRGPVASICYQGLERIGEKMDNIERSIISYGSVQSANLEKGCSWITLFIAMAPSLGFLGTVVGMVMAFDQIQTAGDISPTIVAAGMKVALITTIFGIIVALILQLFYNYILSKIDHLTSQMEESAITLMDSITKYKKATQGSQSEEVK
jgi:biopolymer transport protein ExbB